MMIMETSSRRPPLEPVLPLINVVFLLLIFFMLAGQLAKRPTVAVEAPMSQTANGEEARNKLLLVMQNDGQWFAEDSAEPLSDEALLALLGDKPEEAEVRLLADAGIIRNKLKIRAAINNAARFLEVQSEFGQFSNYIWAFVENAPTRPPPTRHEDYPATSPASDALSQDLKKRGLQFVGSPTVYAHMQDALPVTDHRHDYYLRPSP